jgi:hypothetical protein
MSSRYRVNGNSFRRCGLKVSALNVAAALQNVADFSRVVPGPAFCPFPTSTLTAQTSHMTGNIAYWWESVDPPTSTTFLTHLGTTSETVPTRPLVLVSQTRCRATTRDLTDIQWDFRRVPKANP